MTPKDQIYNTELPKREFTFDKKVADVFADMIARSVPGYLEILSYLPTLCRWLEPRLEINNFRVYDLGCSLGDAMKLVGRNLDASRSEVIGIDTSRDMLNGAQKNLSNEKFNFQLLHQDVCEAEITDAGLVLLNFTLQFIAVENRDELLKTICKGMTNNSVLVLSEKTVSGDGAVDSTMIDLHHQFKADQGYSELEIAQKRDALEGVLIPETVETHKRRLRSAGFSEVFVWQRHFQFISIVALK